jgi:hypothetical protein
VAAGQLIFVWSTVEPSWALRSAAVAGGSATGTSTSTTTVALVTWVLPCSSAVIVTG